MPFLTAILLLLFIPVTVLAETKTIISEATYLMGDGETPAFAESMVLQKAKQTALEEAGTYVESYTKIHNLDLTTEEIQTLAGGILEVSVLDQKMTLVGTGLHFFTKIKATVTTDKMEQLAQRIRGKNVATEYKKLQEQYAGLEREMETWKAIARKAPSGQERDLAIQKIQQTEKDFGSIQQSETALFEQFVSGEQLNLQAQRQIDEQRAKKDNLASLWKTILDHGHVITIGDPTPRSDRSEVSGVELTIPVTIRTTDNVRQTVKGTVSGLATAMEAAQHKWKGPGFVFQLHPMEADDFRNFLSGLRLIVRLSFSKPPRVECAMPGYGLIALVAKDDGPVKVPAYGTDTFEVAWGASAGYFAVFEGPYQSEIRITIPSTRFRELSSVSAKFVEATHTSEQGVCSSRP